MSDLRTVRNRVLTELNRSDLTAQAALAITDAIRHYEAEPFWFTEKRDAIATVADQEYYDLTSSFITEISVVLEDDGNVYRLDKRHITTLEGWATTTDSTGKPTDYAVYGKQLRMYPVPDESYTLRLMYAHRLPELVNETDTNDWLTTGETLIRSRACANICLRVLQEPERGAAFAALEHQAFRKLLQERDMRSMTGYTRRYTW